MHRHERETRVRSALASAANAAAAVVAVVAAAQRDKNSRFIVGIDCALIASDANALPHRARVYVYVWWVLFRWLAVP